MKGSLANIGAMKLSNLALELENASRKLNTVFCAENLPSFLEKLEYLYLSLKEAFSAEQYNPLVITPELLSTLTVIFNKLITAFDETDFIAIEEGMENLSALQIDSDLNEEIEKIKDAVLTMDYEAAKEVMQNLIKLEI
jgi:HPt (histidine-containing phosphotransfer) domain-containing protein